jgi:hypothetical protein
MSVSKVCASIFLVTFSFWGNEISRAQKATSALMSTGIATMQQPNTASPMLSQWEFANPDCSGSSPAGYTRIFVAGRNDGKPGTGSASDPFDGSAPQKFDTLLRSRSEGNVTKLVVCIGPGTFQTEGIGDYVQGQGHLDKSHPSGFTVNQSWKIHGAGQDKTTLRLIDLFADSSNGKYHKGIIIGTYNNGSSGVEVSDLTLDDNYPVLKPRYRSDIGLVGVILRSDSGHQWVHNIRVMNASGEVEEDFPIEISSFGPQLQSKANLVENVTLDHWAGGRCTGIAIVNGEAEVRNNKVIGYQVAYGGWTMSNVNFHDNQAIETAFGFNIDSWQNTKIIIAHNQIVRPLSYGMVIGGKGNFTDFSITDNTVTLRTRDPRNPVYGLIFQGNVQRAHVLRNKIIADPAGGRANTIGFFEKGTQNLNNVFQENIVTDSFQNTLQGSDCLYGNVNESGKELRTLRNTQNTRCQAEQ